MGTDSVRESDVAGAVGASADEFEVAPHRPAGVETYSRKNAVKQMLADARKISDVTHHIYDEGDRPMLRSGNDLMIPTDRRNKRSGFDRRLAYKGPYFGYFIQNRKIYKGGTHVVQLSDVPEEVTDTKQTEGYPKQTVELRKMIAFALSVSDQEALQADPLRCKVCIEFRGDSDMDLMVHFREDHPAELDELVAGVKKMRAERLAEEEAEANRPPAPAPQKPKRQTFRAAQ